MLNNLELKDAEILWNYHCRIDSVDSFCDGANRIIIGLGSYDLRVAQYCAYLYQQKIAKKILFTGKSGNWTIGKWEKTEAEIFAIEAEKLNIPQADILIEPQATNIGENIFYAKQVIEKSSLHPQQIILVTKPNATRRAYATFLKQWPTMPVRVMAPPVAFNQLAEGQTTHALINELVGDLQRILLYPEKQFQIAQEVPLAVLSAYQRLREAGYTEHCIQQ